MQAMFMNTSSSVFAHAEGGTLAKRGKPQGEKQVKG
jgi:hypothetical protein